MGAMDLIRDNWHHVCHIMHYVDVRTKFKHLHNLDVYRQCFKCRCYDCSTYHVILIRVYVGVIARI